MFAALAKLDLSLLKESKDEAFKQIHRMIDAIPIPKYDVRVGSPLIPQSTRGYDISMSHYAPVATYFESVLMFHV